MERRANLLFLVYASEIGGTERMVETLATGLPAHGFATAVACLRGEGPFPARLRAAGVATRVLDLRRDPAAMARLVSLLRRRSPDIIHTFVFGGNLAGRIAARMAGVPRVVTSQRSTDPWKTPLHWMIERVTSPLVDACISNSRAGRDVLVRRTGFRPARIAVIPNGIPVLPPPTAPAGPGRALAVGTVGNLRAPKGHAVLLAAFQRVLVESPDVRLEIVGEGPLRPSLAAEAARRGLADRISFPGFLDDPRPLMSGWDVFVLPSLWEGCPVSLLEAMMAARPCVASAVGDVPDIIRDGENGLLVPPGDAAALAGAIRLLLRDGGLRARLGNAARATAVRRHSEGTMLAAYAACYRAVLRRDGRGDLQRDVERVQ